jgi:hypothetical protein
MRGAGTTRGTPGCTNGGWLESRIRHCFESSYPFLKSGQIHFAPVNRRDCSRGPVSGENACATVAARWLDKFSARRSVGLGGETRLLGKDAVRKSTPANWIGEDFRDFTRAGCFRRSMDVALSIRSPDRTVSADGGLQLRHPVRTSGSY